MNKDYYAKELSIHDKEYLDVCRLRYKIISDLYLQEKKDLIEDNDVIPALKHCKYDNHSAIFAVYKKEACIGSIRLIIRDYAKNNFLEIEESKMNKIKPFLKNDLKIAEIGRLVVDKDYRAEAFVVF